MHRCCPPQKPSTRRHSTKPRMVRFAKIHEFQLRKSMRARHKLTSPIKVCWLGEVTEPKNMRCEKGEAPLAKILGKFNTRHWCDCVFFRLRQICHSSPRGSDWARARFNVVTRVSSTLGSCHLPFQLEFAFFPIGHHAPQLVKEGGAVMWMVDMAKLVRDHIVDSLRGGTDQHPVEHQIPPPSH